MKPLRIAAALSFVLLAVLGAAGPAGAGGSNWDFDAPTYQPGDTVHAVGIVAWEHNPTLGTPEDGPYGAWIRSTASTTPSGSGSWPSIPADALYVGDLDISLEPYRVGGEAYGPHHATVAFVLPGLPQGEYELLHCNWPCTTTLGDITFGAFTVGQSPTPTTTTAPAPPPTTVASTTTAAPPSSTPTTTSLAAEPLVADAPGSGPPAPLVVVGATAGATALAGLGLGLRGRRQPMTNPT